MSCYLLSTIHVTLPFLLFFFFLFFLLTSSQSSLCHDSCGTISINFPLSIDDGCGSPHYNRLLFCSSSTSTLHLRTPSGIYTVLNISYSTSNPHLIVSDPSMFSSCNSTFSSAMTTPFALDTSTHLTLSPQNTFLFLNCSKRFVLVEPKLDFCRTFPNRCGNDDGGVVCDSAGYLCRQIPRCANGLFFDSCCEYFPQSSESIRMMLRHCDGYSSMYWRKVFGNAIFREEDEVAEFGIKVDFEIPMTEKCRRCEVKENGGGGVCGFDTTMAEFLCLCEGGNVTTHCGDVGQNVLRHKSNTSVIIGTVIAGSVIIIGSAVVAIWFLKKMRGNKVVACGVQSNENRLF